MRSTLAVVLAATLLPGCGSFAPEPAATASFQVSREAASSVLSTTAPSGTAYEASRCIRITLLCASRFSA